MTTKRKTPGTFTVKEIRKWAAKGACLEDRDARVLLIALDEAEKQIASLRLQVRLQSEKLATATQPAPRPAQGWLVSGRTYVLPRMEPRAMVTLHGPDKIVRRKRLAVYQELGSLRGDIWEMLRDALRNAGAEIDELPREDEKR